MRTPDQLQALAAIDAAISRLESIDNRHLSRSEIRKKYLTELRFKELRRRIYRSLLHHPGRWRALPSPQGRLAG